jgi:hypothetical protein
MMHLLAPSGAKKQSIDAYAFLLISSAVHSPASCHRANMLPFPAAGMEKGLKGMLMYAGNKRKGSRRTERGWKQAETEMQNMWELFMFYAVCLIRFPNACVAFPLFVLTRVVV